MNLPILMTLIAAVCYGLSAPAAKLGFNRGMHADGFLLPYGLGLLLFSCIGMFKNSGLSGLYPTQPTVWFGLLAGGLCAVGFKLSGSALSIPGTSVSMLQVLIACYPVVTACVSVPLFREYEQVSMSKLLIGMTFVLVGVAVIATAKPAEH